MKYSCNLQLGEGVQGHKGFWVNKLDVIPTQVSARQGHTSKKRAEQGSEAAGTGLAKGPGGSIGGICSPLVSSKFCPIAAPHRQVWVCRWVVSNRGHKSLPCRSSFAETNGKGPMGKVLFWLNFCKFGNFMPTCQTGHALVPEHPQCSHSAGCSKGRSGQGSGEGDFRMSPAMYGCFGFTESPQ